MTLRSKPEIFSQIERPSQTMASDADMRDGGFEYSDGEPEEQDVDIENWFYDSEVDLAYREMSSYSLPKPLIGCKMRTGGGILHASDTQPVQASFSHSRPTSMEQNAGG
ncbi:hypothetical protein MUK42_01902 [Musa troglodytarum]|uniref:Uncharacterized protein n=1 Tax=Musa troglodytarum TaxID=320322 RepID=A0A9E7FA34_9LILI|nr:hypothetical protein MUK42_01902 [Musa troglodytarum]